MMNTSVCRIYLVTIEPSPNSGAQDVYCDMETDGGGWTQFAFLGVDPDGNDYRYSAIFSELALGEVGNGSFKIAYRHNISSVVTFKKKN